MNIQIIRAEAPYVEPEILADLEAMDPRVFLQWNSMFAREPWNEHCWEGRWELWCELQPSRHKDATNKLYKTDRWNPDTKTWMRRLQTYKNADGSFAPADRALIIGLEMADGWENSALYDKHIAQAWDRDDRERMRLGSDAIKGGAEYYRKQENPIVGPYANSGWRWRLGI